MRTLHGRTVALLLSAILSAVLLTALVTGSTLRQLWQQQSADWAAQAVLAAEAGQPGNLRRSVGPAPEHELPPPFRRFGSALERALGEPLQLRLQTTPERWLWIRRQSGGDWTLLPLQHFDPRWPLPLALLALIGSIALLIVWFASRYTRMLLQPVQALRRAMQADAQASAGSAPQPVAASGPDELSELIHGYNTLRAQRHASEQERAVLLASLPHDLRAPLTRLKLRAALIEDDETQRALLRDVDALQDISQQFLDYLRGLDGAASPPETLHLSHWLAERAAHYQGAGDDVRLVSSADDNLRIAASPQALLRVLDNLVGNALKHGRAPVLLRLAREGHSAVLAVEDAGAGIPAAQHSAALAPFVQLDAARGAGGAGLGLAIVRQLAQRMGAELTLGAAACGGLRVQLRFAALGSG
ncbi:MAG: ATP-binding protein [Stagnimonas sp.]|nr:ATP-binding protein [Stagnimonas sp.]